MTLNELRKIVNGPIYMFYFRVLLKTMQLFPIRSLLFMQQLLVITDLMKDI